MAASVGFGFMSTPVVWPAPDYGAAPESLRELFRFLGLKKANPLGRWIRPGMTVVIKPNWVKHEFGETEGRNVLYTHSSLVRALLDAAVAAAGKSGRVYVADAPLQGCDFARLRRQSGLEEMEREYADRPVTFLDLRRQWAEIDDASSFVRGVHALAGDPNGYSLVDLGTRSRLAALGRTARFGVTDYDVGSTNGYHSGGHQYLVSNTVLGADVILNVPKLKTHIKTGMTGALKNFVGIVGSKDCLPHFRPGPPGAAGDEYPNRSWVSQAASPVREALQARAPLWVWKLARAAAPRTAISGGAWHGNDTLWRTVHDLVDIARHYGVGGALRERPRPILTLVDAIVAGEGRGPLKPSPKACGRLIWGEDPGEVDTACAALMGFDWRRIPLLRNLPDFEPSEVRPVPFAAPPGWVGEIEMKRVDSK